MMFSTQNRLLAAVIIAGGACFAGPPAQAAPDSGPAWENGCSYRVPSGIPGMGYGITADACARLRFCQSMADQGRDMSAMACFGFQRQPRPTDRRL